MPYCSVKCCKEHKLSCSIESKGTDVKEPSITKKNHKSASSSEYLPSDSLTLDPIENAKKRRQMLDDSDSDNDSVDEHGWGMTKEMMDKLDNSSWLRKELADGGLRQMIATIDNADWETKNQNNDRKRKRYALNAVCELTPREAALERAKYSNPNFAKFIDKMMLTAGLLIDNENIEEKLAALLNGDLDQSALTLVPVASKRQLNIEKEDENQTSDSSSSNSESDDDSEVDSNE